MFTKRQLATNAQSENSFVMELLLLVPNSSSKTSRRLPIKGERKRQKQAECWKDPVQLNTDSVSVFFSSSFHTYLYSNACSRLSREALNALDDWCNDSVVRDHSNITKPLQQ